MTNRFSAALAGLRRDSGINQRQLAAELKISQALLSHYENGAREPGLDFVCRACEYFGVTADFLLGRDTQCIGENAGENPEKAVGISFSKIGDGDLRRAAEDYASAAVRRVFAHINSSGLPLEAAAAAVEMSEAELRLLSALEGREK